MAKSTFQSIPLSCGQTIELNIDSMAYDNSALARYKDFVVFVDRGAPGDSVLAEITTLRPNYARAKIVEIKKSDPKYRIEAPCKLFKVCGGCQWQHLSYEKQLEQKDLLLENFFSKLKLDGGVLKNIIGTNDPWNYRNKVQYPVRTVSGTGRLKAGYFEWHSNELVNVKHCPIQHNLFDEIIETVRELAPKYKIVAYDGRNKTGWLRHICVRVGINTNEALLTLVAVNENFSRSQEFVKEIMDKYPQLVGICFNINTNTTNVIYGEKTKVIKGRGYIFEEINGLRFKISATSFFQVNTTQTTKLLNIIEDMTCSNSSLEHTTVLDAYCGVGLISLSLAKHAKKIIGIEEIKQSIEDATFSTKENNIKNVSFKVGKVENKIKELLENENPEVIVLDPPRIGCNKKVLESILSSSVKKIVYISCNPSTLIRDLEILCKGGGVGVENTSFKVKSIQPIDMFPHSYHIECVVLVERNL